MNAKEIIENINEIYDKFPVPKFLQEHMRSVAKVSKQICEKIYVDVDNELLFAACLLHDMGNLVKFDFSTNLFGDDEDENFLFWKEKQVSAIQKYGSSASIATEQILIEANISKKIISLIKSASWDRIQKINLESDWNTKICAYSDYRVTPNGIKSLKDRLNDIQKRYIDSNRGLETLEDFNKMKEQYFILEKQLIEKGLIPENIK